MSQAFHGSYVRLSLRLLSFAIVAGILWFDYRRGGFRDLLTGLVAIVAAWFFNWSLGDSKKIADRNMRKYGLDPDRDEGRSRL